ncbi:MAG: LptF/LptG family permease [Bacteroidia bacterium]|nr:LptF/LptG family permease [Bacteroidia bacterium]
MKRLHIYMIKTYMGPFLMTFFISVFLLLMQFLWKYIDEFVGKGIETSVMTQLLMYASVNFIPMALPLAILLSSIMTFGSIGEHYELVALKSSGISLLRIMYPLIIFISFISIGALLFSNYVLPVANLKFYSLLYDVRNIRPEINIKPGIFYNGIDDYSIRVQSKDKKTNILYGVMIYDQTNRQGNTTVIVADSGKILMTEDKRYLLLTLYNGEKYEELREDNQSNWRLTHPHQKDKFSEEDITIELKGFGFNRTDESQFTDNYKMLNIKQLQHVEDSLQKSYNQRDSSYKAAVVTVAFLKKIALDTLASKRATIDTFIHPDSLYKLHSNYEKSQMLESALTIARSQSGYLKMSVDELEARENFIVKHKVEFHLKFTLAFACLILFFIGAPLGAIIRKGGLGMPVVVSVLLFILYYIISLVGEKFAKELILPAWAGVWLSSAVLFPLGLFLTYKAASDSVIFNIDLYLEPIKKLFDRILKRKVRS